MEQERETSKSEQDHAEETKVVVVICGGGPAGILLAHYLLAFGEAKFKVILHEKGDDPRVVAQQGASLKRYSIGLNERGIRCIEVIPGLYEKVIKQVVVGKQMSMLMGKKVSVLKMNPKDPRLWLVDRFSLCAALLDGLMTDHAETGLLEVHFRSACTSVNLAEKTVSFAATGTDNSSISSGASISTDDMAKTSEAESAAAGDVTIPYDLLVGADGVRSVVRHAFISHLRNFCYETRDIFNTWHSIQIPAPKDYPLETIHVIPWVSKTEGVQAIGIPSPDNTISFLWGWGLNKHPSDWFACKTPEEAQEFVNSRVPYLNMSKEAAWQFLKQPGHTTMQVKCGTYHDAKSSAVLIGDAAHATSPAIGQGCNSSLCDVAVLGRLLLGTDVNETNRVPNERPQNIPLKFGREYILGRMARVLNRFSALQVKEGQAVVDLSDAAACIDKRLQLWFSIGLVVRSFFHKLLPFLVTAPVQQLCTDPSVPYSLILQRYASDTAIGISSNAKARQEWFLKQSAEIAARPIDE